LEARFILAFLSFFICFIDVSSLTDIIIVTSSSLNHDYDTFSLALLIDILNFRISLSSLFSSIVYFAMKFVHIDTV